MNDRHPTSIDIAHLAGVSQSTVSRALRNSPLVSLETRQKVQQIAKELNYIVDKSASNLRSKSSKTIALLIREDPTADETLINPFFLKMMGSITRASAENGYDLLVSFQQMSDNWRADYHYAHRADGIIFLGYGNYINYTKKVSGLAESNTHFVIWGPSLEDYPLHSVGCNNHQGACLATEHLIENNRRRIAFLGDTSSRSPELCERFRGYEDSLKKHGIEVDPALNISADVTEESGNNALLKLLDNNVQFDAIFAASDMIAIGAMNALRENGRSVPNDVCVVGFDDIQAASYIRPGLTTVRQDTTQAGKHLVKTLLQMIAGETIAPSLLPTELIIRKSSIPNLP